MIKIFLLILLLIGAAFFVDGEAYRLFVRAFDVSFDFSIFTLAAVFVFILYLTHLALKPFEWFKNYRHTKALVQASRHQNLLFEALTCFLSQDKAEQKQVLKKATHDTPSDLIIQALLAPNEQISRKLLLNSETELVGLKNLYQQAKDKGDFLEGARLLDHAKATYPNVEWPFKETYQLAVLQENWDEALTALNILKDRFTLTKEQYRQKKADILFHQGQFKEAYALAPDNESITLAYAKEVPKKARSILKKAYELAPSWEIYQAFRHTLTKEPPSKRLKLVKDLTKKAPMDKISLLLNADTAIDCQLWGVAKETLETYLAQYALTPEIALMMAEIERMGWNHQDDAKEWERKAMSFLTP